MISSRHITVSQVELDKTVDHPNLDRSRVLFLDFDGVLHPDEQRFEKPFCFMDNFTEAVRDADPTGKLQIVIASSWRIKRSMDELVVHFPMDIATRIQGVTPNLVTESAFEPGIRQREVQAWMAANAPAGKWLAIDDHAGIYAPGCESLFHIPHTDATLEADMYAAQQPLSEADKARFRERKRRNRTVGLNEDHADRLRLCLFEFMRV